MPEKPEIYENHAKECRRQAEIVSAPDLKLTYRDLAAGWIELAALRRRLDAEKSRRST